MSNLSDPTPSPKHSDEDITLPDLGVEEHVLLSFSDFIDEGQKKLL